MDETTSFLEHSLDTNLYETKKFYSARKPLRILITQAGGKIAYNLIYKICSGSIFGPDQEIIIHMINSRGSLHHKTIVLELEECGFPCYKDFVVSSNPAVAMKNVDYVIAITTFEEIPGWEISGAVVYQTMKALQLAKHVEEFASKDCKIIFTGPATKSMMVMLSAFQKFDVKFHAENITCVTHLDTVISKAVLASKLKTTTDRIKNVIIWSNTYPDVRNATVKMYPPNDRGAWDMTDIPVADAVQDDEWLYSTFGLAIFKRVLNVDLINHGKAIAMSTAHHLKVLFEGSDNFEEIFSMAVITPSTKPYGLPNGRGFSYPVITEKGRWKILQDVPINVCTQINMMKAAYQTSEEKMKDKLIKVVAFMLDYEISKKQVARLLAKNLGAEVLEIKQWSSKYYVIPNPAEEVEKVQQSKHALRKSITWDDAVSSIKKLPVSLKPSIRFNPLVSESSLKNGFRSHSNENNDGTEYCSPNEKLRNSKHFLNHSQEKFETRIQEVRQNQLKHV